MGNVCVYVCGFRKCHTRCEMVKKNYHLGVDGECVRVVFEKCHTRYEITKKACRLLVDVESVCVVFDSTRCEMVNVQSSK